MSSSEGELEIDVGDVDDSICIICNSSTYVGETIACETCQLWFHWPCVGVKAGDEVVVREVCDSFEKEALGGNQDI